MATPTMIEPTTMERMGFILPKSRVTASWKKTITNGLAMV